MTTIAPFVGRDSEMHTITEAIRRARSGRLQVVMVEGAAGVGKTLLVEQAIIRAIGTAGPRECLGAVGRCYEETGQRDAFEPFTEVLETIARTTASQPKMVRTAGTVIRKTAPDWLQILPVVGSLLSAGAKTFTAGVETVAESRTARDKTESFARRCTRTIAEAAASRDLLLIVLEDAHWIDAASCDLLMRLTAELGQARIAFILTYRPKEFGHNDALVKLRAYLTTRVGVETVVVQSLTETDIAAYLHRRFGTVFFPALPRWLVHLCGGHALFVVQYLNLLEEEGIIVSANGAFTINGAVEDLNGEWRLSGQLATMPIARDVATLLDQRIDRLEDEERQMLELAAVQGHQFGSLVLARVFERKEPNVLAQLRRVSERHRIIKLFTGIDWLRERSEIYTFEHFLMQQALYRKLSPRERLIFHGEIADVLQPLIAEYENPPRRLLLDVARHRRNSQRYLEAARHYYAAATSSYLDGVTVETASLCEEASACLRELPEDGSVRDSLFAESVLLQLVCTGYGPIDLNANQHLIDLAAEGERAASRAKNLRIQLELQSATGQLFIRAGNVGQAVAVMRRAVLAARTSNDRMALFFTLSQLGKQLAKEDLKESLDVRYEARSLHDAIVSDATVAPDERAMLSRQAASLTLYIGVGELDRGDLEKAIDVLEGAVRDLLGLHMYDDALAGHNYLAQAYLGVGRYEDAERELQESITSHTQRNESTLHPWLGYNLAVLAKTYVEQGRLEEANHTMTRAVRISEATRQADLLTLVRNYQAELLIREGHSCHDLEAAERVLHVNVEESRSAGFHRSTAMSLSLLGILRSARGQTEDAEQLASEAVGYIESHGDMPALRTEEVYFNHYLVLHSVDGREELARASLERAHDVIKSKADRLQRTINQDSFRNVPLCQAIYAAIGSRTIDAR